MSLLSAPGSVLIKITFMKSLPDAPDCVLVKTSTDNSRWQTGRDALRIEVPGAYTFLR